MELQEVIDQFEIEGRIDQINSHGNGHIHETFHVINQDEDAPDYLLQKINHEVFKDVSGMMNNIKLVTDFLQQQSPDRINLALVPTKKGKAFFENEGSYWRVFVFLEGLISYDTLTDENLVYEGGRVLGDFLNRLSGLAPDKLVETIPDFHDLSYRFGQFGSALEAADESIKSRVAQEIEFVQKLMQSNDFEFVSHMPIRVTHNDTKLNNVLFDAKGSAQCVIDLDTVMPGLVHYDVGDAIRTACATSAEDEADLQSVGLDLDRVRAFCVGYLEATRDSLVKEELETLHLSIPLMSLIMGVRFLTDFLQGDVYYKTHYPDQNMHRAKAQFRQTSIAMDQIADLKHIIRRA